MGKTLIALLIKFTATFGATWVAFGLMANKDLSTILLVSILGTVLNYALGDLVVLPKYGNAVAAIGDGIMGALVAIIVSQIVQDFSTPQMSLVAFAALIIGFEALFHIYLKRADIPPHIHSH